MEIFPRFFLLIFIFFPVEIAQLKEDNLIYISGKFVPMFLCMSFMAGQTAGAIALKFRTLNEKGQGSY